MEANPSMITLTGVGQGTTMAAQMQVIHSDIFAGSVLMLGQGYGVNKYIKNVSDKLDDNLK